MGIAFAYNNIQDTVKSLIDGSIVMADTGDVVVSSVFAEASDHLPPGLDSQIAALAVSGGGAKDIAGAGSVSLNWIHNEVTAKIAKIGNLNTNAARHNGDDLFAGNKLRSRPSIRRRATPSPARSPSPASAPRGLRPPSVLRWRTRIWGVTPISPA